MFCLFNKIFICGIAELQTLNFDKFTYMLNCSVTLNNIIQNSNYINLILDKPLNLLIDNIICTLDIIYN
jgi:hypothetical protein